MNVRLPWAQTGSRLTRFFKYRTLNKTIAGMTTQHRLRNMLVMAAAHSLISFFALGCHPSDSDLETGVSAPMHASSQDDLIAEAQSVVDRAFSSLEGRDFRSILRLGNNDDFIQFELLIPSDLCPNLNHKEVGAAAAAALSKCKHEQSGGGRPNQAHMESQMNVFCEQLRNKMIKQGCTPCQLNVRGSNASGDESVRVIDFGLD